MKLSMLLSQARSGELASLSAKDKTDEIIVGYLNLALIALYNKFQLSTQEAIITLRPDLSKTVYTMDSLDADVKVAGQPMVDDTFMAIVEAYNEDGSQISVNDEKDPYSIYTVSYNQLQIPLLGDINGVTQSYVSVIYRENPMLIEYVDDGTGNATDATVRLPIQLTEAALHYVGYRAHGSVNGNVKAENNTHYTRFLRACDEARTLGIISADDVVGTTVEEKGFL